MSFTQLPHELLCDILEATNSLRSIVAVSRTCKALNKVWRANKETICATVLPGLLPAYQSARDAALAALHSSDENAQSPSSSDIFDEEREASMVLDVFIANFVRPWGKTRFFWPKKIEEPLLSKTECRRFIQGYHTLKIIIFTSSDMKNDQLLTKTLQRLTAHTYFNTRDVAKWLCDMHYKPYRTRWSQEVTERTEELYSRLPQSATTWWSLADRKFQTLAAEHPAIANRRQQFQIGAPDRNPEGIFTLFDQCQDEVQEIPSTQP